MVNQTCVIGRHLLENEQSEPVISREQLTVFVAKD